MSHISALKDSELLYERGIFLEITYIFNRVLTCGVVYDSILATRKKKIQNEIGMAMEDKYSENIGEQ